MHAPQHTPAPPTHPDFSLFISAERVWRIIKHLHSGTLAVGCLFNRKRRSTGGLGTVERRTSRRNSNVVELEVAAADTEREVEVEEGGSKCVV